MSTVHAKDIHSLRGILTGNRVLVRPFTVEDISEVYLGWLHDPEVMRFSNQRFSIHTRDTCLAYFASFKNSANYFLAICDRRDGTMVGTLTVYRSVPHATADIGIMVGERRVWGHGVGAEAFALVLAALRSSGLIRKVTAGTLVVNRGMLRVMEKAGMQREATRQAQELIDGVPVDVVYYAAFCHD